MVEAKGGGGHPDCGHGQERSPKVYKPIKPISQEFLRLGLRAKNKYFYRSGRGSTQSTTVFFNSSRALSLENTPGNAKKSCTAFG